MDSESEQFGLDDRCHCHEADECTGTPDQDDRAQERDATEWPVADFSSGANDDFSGDPSELPLTEDQAAERFALEFEPLMGQCDDRAAELLDSFVSTRNPLPAEQRRLQRFAHLCLRFANLETRIEGTIRCEIPAHLSVLANGPARTLIAEAEELADAERRRLEIPPGPIENLSELLDERGIKVVEWGAVDGKHAGAFLFDPDTGPALLSLTPAGSAAGRFVLAHEYCHLLADVDPYENRFCLHGSACSGPDARWGGRFPGENLPGDSPIALGLPEARADLFARAFLLPREHFIRTLGMFGEGAERGFHIGRLGELAFYYDVETAVVLNRLVDLDLLPASEATAMAAALVTKPQRAADADSRVASATRRADDADGKTVVETLPVRFVNLSLALFVGRIASRDHLARLLDVDRRAVGRLLSWLDLPADFKERLS